MIPTRNKSTLFFLSFIVILAVNIIIFYPSFFHIARADQLDYLNMTANDKNLGDLIKHSYSWPRERPNPNCDVVLFRPVLFSFTALERWLFGLNFQPWQITNFVLHMAVLWQLLRILFLMAPGIFAFLFALFFSILPVSQDIVIWHHIGGYLLFLIFILSAFYHFIQYFQDDNKNGSEPVWVSLNLCLAVFTYEFGIIVNLVFIFFMIWYRGKRSFGDVQFSKQRNILLFFKPRDFLLFVPIALYTPLSILNFLMLKSTFGMIPANHLTLSAFLTHLPSIAVITALYQFLPYFFTIDLLWQRLELNLINQHDIVSIFHAYTNYFLLNIILILLLCLFIIFFIIHLKKNSKTRTKNSASLEKIPYLVGLISFFISFIYILLIAFRSLLHPIANYYLIGLYHFYIARLFFTIGVYYLFVSYMFPVFLRIKAFKILAGAILGLAIMLNSAKTWQTNVWIADKYRPWQLYTQRTQKFIDDHKREKGFSYHFLWKQVDEYVEWKLEDNNWLKGDLSDFFFPNYLKENNPQYYLLYFDKEGLVAFKNKNEADTYLGQGDEKERTLIPLFKD